jgi:hypothetical protein
MPEQRKRAAAVIWETNRDLCPTDRVAPKFILTVGCFLDESSVRPRKAFNLSLRDHMNAALGLRKPVAQGNCHTTTWLEESDQFAEAAYAIGG